MGSVEILPTNIAYPTESGLLWCYVPAVSKKKDKGKEFAIVHSQQKATHNKSTTVYVD
jgi:hypothetical protein